MDLGFARLLMDDLGRAREAFDAAHALSSRLGNSFLHAYTTSKLGLLADAEERFGDALRLHMEANELFESVGDPGGTGYARSRASLSAFGLGDYSEALRLGRAGYEAFGEANHRWGLITALCRIMAEWTSSRSYWTRVKNLRDGSGSTTRANGTFFLKPTTTVVDAGDRDQLTGSSGRDWFFANFKGRGTHDKISGKSGNEVAEDL